MFQYIRLILVIIILFTIKPVYGLEKGHSNELIRAGRRVTSSIILSDDNLINSYTTFKIRVPANVFKMEIKLDSSPVDLDIYINHDQEIENYDNTDSYSTEELYNEKLTISRISSEPLHSGIYYIDIIYPLDFFPEIDGEISTEIPFGLTVKFTSMEKAVMLTPDEGRNSFLSTNGRMMKQFAVDVKKGTEALRIDLYNTKTDLDMYVSYGKSVMVKEEADYIIESYLGRESLVINSESVKPLRTGRYFISVFDRIEDSLTDHFSIVVSFNDEAPLFLKQYPELPKGRDLFENSLFATVEITTETGSGSGCLVSPDGFIITGLHVITNISGEISDNISVSMNLSNYYPPEELFKAKLIDYLKDEDLALLQIVSGLYGQPLVDNYDFPYFRLALEDSFQLGQVISFLGYPQIGSEGSRASISLTRGIISGFDFMDYGYLIKTDGEINSGNSGGAAFNKNYELIGFPMSVISDEGGQIAYIHPVTLIPDDWLELIR